MTDLDTKDQPNFFDHYRNLGRRLMDRSKATKETFGETLDECADAPIAPEPEPQMAPAPKDSVTDRITRVAAPADESQDSTSPGADDELVASLRRRSRTATAEEQTSVEAETELASAESTETDAAPEPMELPALRVAEVAAPLEGLEGIYHNVRALVRSQSPARVVFAGADSADASRSVVIGIAEHACKRGQRVVMAELMDPSGRTLLVRLATPNSQTHSAPLLELDLHGLDARERITQWLERELPETDLLLIAGPALSESVDSALLASACDGLIIVAESGVTDREAIATAAERAKVTNAPTLGVVVDGTRDRLPAWLRRWIPGRRNTLTPAYTDAR